MGLMGSKNTYEDLMDIPWGVYGCAMILGVFWKRRIDIQFIAVEWYEMTETYQADCTKDIGQGYDTTTTINKVL